MHKQLILATIKQPCLQLSNDTINLQNLELFRYNGIGKKLITIGADFIIRDSIKN